MKSFRGYISEEVLPTAQVADGSLDIEKASVRAAINAALAGVTSQPAVTPYVVYNRISKLLAQYHIVLPRKFLEGDKGVEVFEVRQFGHRMGMTNGGEFINEVPTTHYLFVQYGILSPLGITYAKPIVGGMYRVTARLVDKSELDRLLDMAEITMSEEAECRQMTAKAMAPKDPMHDITSDEKKKGNKEAVADSQKGQIEEVSAGLAHRAAHRAFVKSDKMKADAKKEPDMHSYVQAVHKGEKKSKQGVKFAKYAAKKMEEETISEKAPPGAKFERMVKHIKKGYSKDGLTKKEKGIAYATAWKAKKKEELDEGITDVKHSSRGRVFKQRMNTIVKKGLGKEGDTKTVVVTKKGDPKQSKSRISKDRYDPSKHVMVRE